MLQPKRQTYRKQFRGKMKGNAQSGAEINFGEFGLKSLQRSWISARQIEAARKATTHYTKRAGKLWIRIFPDRPVTQKGQGVTMGSGKGDIKEYVTTVKPGRIMFEVAGIPSDVAKEALRRAGQKLPVTVKIVDKDKLL